MGCQLLTPAGGQRSDISPVGLMMAGAAGGMCYWGVPFPFDVVKSKIQTGEENDAFASLSPRDMHTSCTLPLLDAFRRPKQKSASSHSSCIACMP
jgi:hypothetical protein